MPEFPTPDPVSATIEVGVGSVHVIAGDRPTTTVTVSPSTAGRAADVDEAAATQVSYDAGRLTIRGPKQRGLHKFVGPGRRSGSVDVTVELPLDSHVHCDIALGDFRSDGRLGDVRATSGMGHVFIDQARGVHLTSGLGSLTVQRALGPAKLVAAGQIVLNAAEAATEIKNQNGQTHVGDVSGSVRVRSANGDITIGRAHAEVSAKTANGSITVGEVVRGAVSLQTAAGGLDVGIRSGTAAWIDAQSQYGRVRNALEHAAGPEPSQDTVEVRARTAYGDIVIHRPDAGLLAEQRS